MSDAADDVIAELRQAAIRFRDERDWAQFHNPKDLALGLSIEAAELCELFLWKTPTEVERALADGPLRQRLADEMADVLIFLLYLSHATGVALPDAVRAKLTANAVKYPVEKSRGSAAKYTELE